MPTTFNSSQYSWSDVSISLGGRIIEGITAVEYVKKQDKDVLRGRGDKGHKILRGNKSCEGKITIWQSELEALTRDAPGNDILNLTFNIICAYVPLSGGQQVIDILQEVEFLEVKKGMNQGDKNMLVELPIIFIDVLPQQ